MLCPRCHLNIGSLWALASSGSCRDLPWLSNIQSQIPLHSAWFGNQYIDSPKCYLMRWRIWRVASLRLMTVAWPQIHPELYINTSIYGGKSPHSKFLIFKLQMVCQILFSRYNTYIRLLSSSSHFLDWWKLWVFCGSNIWIKALGWCHCWSPQPDCSFESS